MAEDPRILPITENLRAAMWCADDNGSAVLIYFQAREQLEPVCFRITTSAPIQSTFWEMPSLRGANWLSLAESRGTQHYAVAIADHKFLDEPFIIGLELAADGDPRDHVIAAEVWDRAGAEPQIVYIENSA